jgi:hypothetical protein
MFIAEITLHVSCMKRKTVKREATKKCSDMKEAVDRGRWMDGRRGTAILLPVTYRILIGCRSSLLGLQNISDKPLPFNPVTRQDCQCVCLLRLVPIWRSSRLCK